MARVIRGNVTHSFSVTRERDNNKCEAQIDAGEQSEYKFGSPGSKFDGKFEYRVGSVGPRRNSDLKARNEISGRACNSRLRAGSTIQSADLELAQNF